jgi:predicted transcriptional regulator
MTHPHPLAAYLRKHDLSQSEFARRAEITRQHIAWVLSGKPCGWAAAKAIEQATGGAVKALRLVQQGRAA